jgi:hypothetical protein
LNPDAFQLAALRDAQNGTASIVGDLSQVAGSSLGTGYLCYTTDLKLLNSSNGFAEKFNPLSIKLEALPPPIKEALTSALTIDGKASDSRFFSIDSFRDLVGIAGGRKATPKGSLDVSGLAPEVFEQIVRAQLPADDAATLVTRYTEAFDKANSSPVARLQNALSDAPVLINVSDVKSYSAKAFSVADSLGKARDVVQVELSGSELRLRTARRAFLVEMNKSDAMPGVGTLGGRSFENEQEVTGLGKVAPWRILKAYKRTELDLDLPRVEASVAPQVGAPNASPTSTTTAAQNASANVAVADASAPPAAIDGPDAPSKTGLKVHTLQVAPGERLASLAKRMIALAKSGVEVNAKWGLLTLVAKPGDTVESVVGQLATP